MNCNQKHFAMAIMLSFFTLVLSGVPASKADKINLEIAEEITGEAAYEHVYYLSEEIGARVAGTIEAQLTADYILETFEEMDYAVEFQPFSFTTNAGDTIESANIIAVKYGKNDQTVIVGAHYDSVSFRQCDDGYVLTGAGDNASGIGVLLEVAEVLAEYETRGTIIFVAFGAEEMGLQGSRYYAEQMQPEAIAKTVAMIDLDSVGAGDFFYVYSGLEDNPGWVRDMALQIGRQLGYDLRTSPQSDCFDQGTTGDWSDHVPFRLLGIPIAYFEWMNWDIEPCGGIETDAYGWIMHTCRDNLAFTSRLKMELTADVVATLVFKLSRNRFLQTSQTESVVSRHYIGVQKRMGLPD